MDIVRVTQKEEVYKILKEYNNCFEPSLDSMIDNLQCYAEKLAEKSYFIVAKKKGNVVGITAFYMNDFITFEGFVILLAINKKYKNNFEKGIIMANLLKYSREIGESLQTKLIRLEVNKNNQNAISIYKKFGFEIEEEKEKTIMMIIKFENFKI